jgi:hypothetical protein
MGESKLTETEKGKTCEEQSQEHDHIFLWHHGDFFFTKNLSWQAKQSILHTTVMLYGDCMKMCEDFAPNFADKITRCCITTIYNLTLPFSVAIFFTKSNKTFAPPPPTLHLFPQLKIKLKDHHLTQLRWLRQNRRQCYTLTEHNCQDAFKNGRSTGNGAYTQKGITSREMEASRPKVGFWPDGCMNPRNYGWVFVTWKLVSIYKHWRFTYFSNCMKWPEFFMKDSNFMAKWLSILCRKSIQGIARGTYRTRYMPQRTVSVNPEKTI